MNNLPGDGDSFVGRERETAEVKRSLANVGLVVLVGIGGIGKTRLALHVAAGLEHEYPDGVWFVDLSNVPDSRLVTLEVASVFGLKEEVRSSGVGPLLQYVADRRLLLVLDGCERVAQACSALTASLLQAAPHLKILATSRENLSGGTTYLLGTLSTSEAMQLLVDRAVAAKPDFHLTDRTAAAATELCQLLDGLPLAIELAAARVRVISIDALVLRMRERFRHLSASGGRSRLTTLRAALDWSYDLLTDAERALLRRLAVFAGGATVEAIERVCGGGGLRTTDVLENLSALVQKSLIAADASSRYTMLESVRDYASERLTQSGEEARTRSRHFGYYSSLAAAHAQLNRDHRNLEAALAWAFIERNDHERRLSMEVKRLLRVFLCHASEDKARVRELSRRLRADEYSPWLDEEQILPGQDWDLEIRKAVRSSHVVVVCLSARSIDKAGYVQKEIRFALDVADEQPEGRIFVIPLKLEPCDVPSRLQRWHWVTLDEPSGYKRLLLALEERARGHLS